MASQTPGGQSKKLRHRITNIKLQPSTSDYDISLKVLVDGQEVHRLPAIRRGTSLSWERTLPCDVDPSSRVELRVYEKHLWRVKRVGTLEYVVSTVASQLEAILEFDTRKFTAALSFPTPEEAQQAPATAFAEAQAMKDKIRPLARLGATRDAFKTVLDFGGAVAELHPAAKIAFGVCTIAWQTLEKQEQCDSSVEELIIGLSNMLPLVDRVKTAASLPPLQNTVEAMLNLIEDASRFVIGYRSDGGPVQSLRAVVGSKAQDQVQDLLEKFRNRKEDLDRGVIIQTLETVNVVHEAILTGTERTLLNELKPVGSARYDSTRACLPGTRADIIKEIVDWSQQQGASKGLLNSMAGSFLQASFSASAIARSVVTLSGFLRRLFMDWPSDTQDMLSL
ncbi:hypothetical protein BDV93DRAFT_68204 [Ceratobasidium sp. AG-I]|nr:hypothetical protein BDV93DRAFT_68204 [Ceratobasidium sp. AG-I]